MTYIEAEKKHKYYIDNRDRILQNAKERYAKRHPRKNAKCYQIITPDNTIVYKKTFIEVSDFFGYSEPTMKKLWLSDKLFGYKINKIL